MAWSIFGLETTVWPYINLVGRPFIKSRNIIMHYQWLSDWKCTVNMTYVLAIRLIGRKMVNDPLLFQALEEYHPLQI